MNTTWKWILGLALVVTILAAPLFAGNLFLPQSGYRMMGNGYAWHMPMMYGGGMMGFGMMLLIWLILLGLLVTVGLGIAWLVKALTIPK